MLPFLKAKPKSAGVTTEYRAPDGGFQDEAPSNDLEGLEACGEDLCKAIEAKDYKGIASALKAAFDILESAPHAEGPHTEESE